MRLFLIGIALITIVTGDDGCAAIALVALLLAEFI